MQALPSVPVLLFASSLLLGGCALLPQPTGTSDPRLDTALKDYTSAKARRAADTDSEAQQRIADTRKTFIDTALATAARQQQAGELFQAQKVLAEALKHAPDSEQLSAARADNEAELALRLRDNDCRLGAARARYIAEKFRLLEQRTLLESKDYLQDWKSSRERTELEQLAPQLRDCALVALEEKNLALAEESITAAAWIKGVDYVSSERARLDQLRKQDTAGKPAITQPAKRSTQDTTQQRIRKTRIALQSAMTRGDLRQAKTRIEDLRKLEGDTAQLIELNQAVDDAINAYISMTNDQATALYREQKIEPARDLWQKILELDPDNAQARANLERAERVLKKLQELQGTPVAPATP